MKVFKLLSMALIAISISTSFTACNNDEEPVVPPIEEEYIDVPLKLSIDASIDITDEPISRAGNQNPVYAIEVQEINPNTSLISGYAYGFFRNLNNITVKLKKNREYLPHYIMTSSLNGNFALKVLQVLWDIYIIKLIQMNLYIIL